MSTHISEPQQIIPAVEKCLIPNISKQRWWGGETHFYREGDMWKCSCGILYCLVQKRRCVYWSEIELSDGEEVIRHEDWQYYLEWENK